MSRTRNTKKEEQIKAKFDGKSLEDTTKWRPKDDDDSESEVEIDSESEQEDQTSQKSKRPSRALHDGQERPDLKGNKKGKIGIKPCEGQNKLLDESKRGKERKKIKPAKEGDHVDGTKKKSEKSSKRSGLCSIFFYLIFPFSIVLVAVFARDYIPEEIRPDFLNMGKPEDKYDYPKVFGRRMEDMKRLFPNQTERFWRILKNKGLAHLRDKNPKQPLVILLGAPPSAHSTIDCLARKLAWCLDPEVNQSNIISGKEYSHGDGHKTKEILDKRLEELFAKGVRSALVLHLELLPPPSPNLFYKYCDNDNSPYKHAGIIFTVHLPQEIDSSLKPAEAEGSIERYLAQVAWVNYPSDGDAISALLSRIADTVALVNNESDDVIKSACNS